MFTARVDSAAGVAVTVQVPSAMTTS
jgi:hypothetical protein